jgi:hypothetical protein
VGFYANIFPLVLEVLEYKGKYAPASFLLPPGTSADGKYGNEVQKMG